MKTGLKSETIKKTLLVIVAIVFSIIVTETGFRIHGKITDTDYLLYLKELKNSDRLPEDLFIKDDLLTYRLRPDTQALATTSDFTVIYRINSKGIRDKEHTHEKKEGKIRILAIGDSFTFGEGVEYGKRFTEIPENEKVEIINMGVPGYGLDQIFFFFVEQGIEYNSDFLFVFSNEAILNRNNINISQQKISQYKSKINPNTIYLKRNNSFYNINKNQPKFYFLSYLRYNIKLFLLEKRLQQFDKKKWEDIFSNQEDKYETADEYDTANRTKLIVAELNKLCQENNISVVIVNIGTSKDTFLELKNSKEDILHDITYIDFSDQLLELSKKQRLSFKYDPHYNPETHTWIGKELDKVIFNLTRT